MSEDYFQGLSRDVVVALSRSAFHATVEEGRMVAAQLIERALRQAVYDHSSVATANAEKERDGYRADLADVRKAHGEALAKLFYAGEENIRLSAELDGMREGRDQLRIERDSLLAALTTARAVLKSYASNCKRCQGRGIYKATNGCETRWNEPCPDCAAARAAIAPVKVSP